MAASRVRTAGNPWLTIKPMESRRQMATYFFTFGVWAFVTLVAAILTPKAAGFGTHTQLGMPPCPSMLMFGRPCPTCGMTTSFSAFVHGDWALSFSAHPMGWIAYLGLTAIGIGSLVGIAQKRKFIVGPWLNWAIGIYVGVLMIYGIYRFLVFEPVNPTLPVPWQ